MGKNLIIKLAIVLVVAALVYSVFWFFKVGQVEKQITNFINENSAYVSSGEIAVSGFPLSQKIIIKDFKFTIPSPLLNKRQAIVKSLELKSGIFASNFSVTLSEGVSVQDLEGNSAVVEFTKEPEITVLIAEGRIAKFNYQDSGYRILDAEKNVIYSAMSSIVAVESTIGSDEKITAKITANIKDLEGFDIADAYKNAFEKKIMEGIKTGEITLGNNLAVQADPAAMPNAPDAVPAIPATINSPVPAPANIQQQPATLAVADPAVVAPTAEVAAVVPNQVIKSNFTIDAEYILTPNKTEQQAKVPVDPTQIQEVPVQYNKTIKVTNLEFSNSLYKILVNGEMNSYIDDNMPSGSLAIKVEKIDSLLDHVKTTLVKIIEQKNPTTAATATAETMQKDSLTDNAAVAENSYQNFLQKISASLAPVAKELAAKNAVSKEDIAEFDIRREKNLEFLINETSTREILGKF